MVHIHHVRNCLLCHPPSLDVSDTPRGAVPSAGQPRSAYYSGGDRSLFVRADVTYVKQDFSLMLPARGDDGRQEPARYDFVVRERAASAGDLSVREANVQSGPCEQREAVLFALRRLTGRYVGSQTADWQEYLRDEGIVSGGGGSR
jgi:hypothetical protein